MAEESDANSDEVARLQGRFDKWWKSAKPLMVNESMPNIPQKEQPFAIRYEKQLKESGIPAWKPDETFELKKGE